MKTVRADLIVDLPSVGCDDASLAGRKAASLSALAAIGQVPAGFCVTTAAFELFMYSTGLASKVAAMIPGVDFHDPYVARKVSNTVRSLIIHEEMPAAISVAIQASMSAVKCPTVAVRSSGVDEDLASASFAGQYATFLGVKARQVSQVVQLCWASLYNASNLHYRYLRGLPFGDLGIAVLIQEMVPAKKAGVMFTAHPVTNNLRYMVIETCWGLADLLVGGRITPHTFVVDKETLRYDKVQEGTQETERVLTTTGRIRTLRTQRTSDECILSSDELVALARLGKKIESEYKVPQDIEWAASGSDIYLLQSRPISHIRVSH